MRPQSFAVVGFHLLVAPVFVGVAGYNAHTGDAVDTVMQAVLRGLVLVLGLAAPPEAGSRPRLLEAGSRPRLL